MAKYMIRVDRIITDCFEVEADSPEKAFESLDNMDDNCEWYDRDDTSALKTETAEIYMVGEEYLADNITRED